MAWDDEPPPAEAWDAAPPTETELKGRSVVGFAKNLGTDVVDTAKGLYSAGKQVIPFAAKIPGREIESIKQIATGGNPLETPSAEDLKTIGKTSFNIGKGLVNEAKRIGIGELLTGHPINAVEKFGGALYDKPLTTALDVAPVVGAAGKALGFGRAAKGAEMAAEAGNLADDAARAAATEAASPGLRSAIKLRGKTYIGEPGDLHVDVVKRMAEAEGIPESQMYDVIGKIGDQGFSRGDQFLSRAEAAAQTGARPEAAAMRAAGHMEGVPGDITRSAPGAPNPIQMPGEAQNILNQPTTPPPGAPGAAPQAVPMGGTFRETVANLEKQIPQQAKEPLRQAQEFLTQKYARAAGQPGFADTLGDAMIRRAQGMRFRELGGTPGQARVLTQRIGEEGVRELMDIAKERGITRSPIGATRRAATKQLQESSGKAIGGIRELAAKRGATHNAKALVDEIRSQLDAEYLGKGMASGEKGAYTKALEDIKSAATSPEALAKKITEMNRRAVKNKMTQPTGAVTDVANAASRINNNLIKQYLSPKELAFYEKNLSDFGASKIFEKLQSFEVGREMGGRAGVGGLWRNIKQGAMDIGGSKVMENFYDKFGPRLKSTPSITKSIGSLGEGAIDDLLSALDSAIDEVVVK